MLFHEPPRRRSSARSRCPLLNLLVLVSSPQFCRFRACVFNVLVFKRSVFTCSVAREQNRRICKNNVLMATSFHSASGFHLSLLIGENVTISVLLWMRRETTSRLMLPQPSTLSTAIKPEHRLVCVHVHTSHFKSGVHTQC